jgi:hypothetical protein
LAFYFSGTGGGNQTFNLPWPARLVGIDFACSFTSTTDATSAIVYCQLPGLGTSTSSNFGGIVAAVRVFNTGAAGVQMNAVNKYVAIPEPGIMLMRNQLVIGNASANGAMTMLSNMILHFRVAE